MEGLNPFRFRQANGRISTDWHLVAFFLNLLLVLLGYYAAIAFGQLGVVKLIRTGFMGLSLAGIVLLAPKPLYKVSQTGTLILVLFLLLNLAVLPFSLNPTVSLERFLTLLPFLVYVSLFARYLFTRYPPDEAHLRVSAIIGLAYAFPVLVFYATGGSGGRTNIYGQHSQGFYSNQFGWGAAISLACLADFVGQQSRRIGPFLRILMIGFAVASVFLLLISGSRSGLISLGVSVLLLVFFSSRMGLPAKALTIIATVALGVYMIGDPDSALNARLQKTRTQIEKTEARLEAAELAWSAFQIRETTLLTGLGFDYFQEGIVKITGKVPTKSHNSYFELLATTGLYVFLFFMGALVLPFVYVPPLLIIPLFENNYGAGQYLFFPWMLVLFFYVHRRALAKRELQAVL